MTTDADVKTEGASTPGPWWLSPTNHNSVNGAKIMAGEAIDGGLHVASLSRAADKPLCQKEADAALIVAAPEVAEQLGRLIAAIEFEVPPILDGVDADARLRILLRCAREAKSAYRKAVPDDII